MKSLKNKMFLFPLFFLIIFIFSTITAKADYAASVSYSCPSGGTLSGSTCMISGASYAAKHMYTLNGGAVSLSSQKAGIDVLASFPGGVMLFGTSNNGCESFSAGVYGAYYYPGGVTVAQWYNSPGKRWVSLCGNFTGYSCNSGDILSGTSCTSVVTYVASPTYSCPSGGVLAGGICVLSAGMAQCGSATMQIFPYDPASSTNVIPSTNLCSAGTLYQGIQPFIITGYSYMWWCQIGNNKATRVTCKSIPLPVNGACGGCTKTPLGYCMYWMGTPSYMTSLSMCDITNDSPPVPLRIQINSDPSLTWQCTGINGGTTATCKVAWAPVAVNGSCGIDNGGSFASTNPPVNRCASGTEASFVHNAGTGWTWKCNGLNSGTNASCSASEIVPVPGQCGSDNGKTLVSAPTNLCTTGPPSSITGTWNWTCSGSSGGALADCSASQLATGSWREVAP